MPQKRRTGSTRGSNGTRKRTTTGRNAGKAAAKKRTATKRSATKRSATKRTATKRTATKRTATKRTAAKRTATKRSATKRTAAKRTATKSASNNGAAKRASATKKTSAPKSTATRRTQPYEVRRSPIQGKGAFATRDIRRGERIGEYRGERISWEEADRRYDDESQERHHTFLFEVDDETVIDAGVRGSGVKYINHSCDPNCEALIEDGRVFIEALKPIRKGQELFYDYSYVLDEPHTPAVKKRYPCWCGSKNCRGTILARKR
ncbi:MAG TPA: SET domain-containing protein-lysine N-methyltransferase [Longimicrobiales bacterium]|nr:SET domain-containing protein-lysine N-methyltransferase [Longimicrobiales bacterium]